MRCLTVNDDIDYRIDQDVYYYNKSRRYDQIEQTVDNDESDSQQEDGAEGLMLSESGTHQLMVDVVLVCPEQGGVKA